MSHSIDHRVGLREVKVKIRDRDAKPRGKGLMPPKAVIRFGGDLNNDADTQVKQFDIHILKTVENDFTAIASPAIAPVIRRWQGFVRLFHHSKGSNKLVGLREGLKMCKEVAKPNLMKLCPPALRTAEAKAVKKHAAFLTALPLDSDIDCWPNSSASFQAELICLRIAHDVLASCAPGTTRRRATAESQAAQKLTSIVTELSSSAFAQHSDMVIPFFREDFARYKNTHITFYSVLLKPQNYEALERDYIAWRSGPSKNVVKNYYNSQRQDGQSFLRAQDTAVKMPDPALAKWPEPASDLSFLNDLRSEFSFFATHIQITRSGRCLSIRFSADTFEGQRPTELFIA